MSRFSSEKRKQVILVALMIAAVLSGLYFGLIRWQQGILRQLKQQMQAARQKHEDMKKTVESADLIALDLTNVSRTLSAAETQMASGDHLAWMINTVRDFKRPYRNVDIPQFSTILIENNTSAPESPYKQVRMSIAGSAYYFDLGRFVADLENQYPSMRVQNLELFPATTAGKQDPEKLWFKMEIVALVKPE